MSFSSSARFLRFFAALVVLGGVLSSVKQAHALNVHAVYRTACNRELGIIIDVQKREVTLLGLDGNVRRIPRYEVASIAYYPVSGIAINPEHVHQSRPALEVRTLQNGELVPLLIGWPVDFNQERIAFVNLDGQEVVVHRDRIWSLEYLEHLPRRGRAPKSAALDFVHPHAVGFCNQAGSGPNLRAIFPQQFINDQVVIKRELDRLMEGHDEVREYERDQIFYPMPEIYRNETALGLWTSHGRKHGATASRPNNFTPVLYDELSLGPFGYQHRLITGAAPMPFSVHTEVQTQIYYRFKAAYFHASAMFDPNLLLVGSEYEWQIDDLAADRPDLRVVEALMVELGFDWGPVALQISPGALGMIAARNGGAFATEERALFRFGPRITLRDWEAELLVGVSDEGAEYARWVRLNGSLNATEALVFNASVLARKLALPIYEEVGEELRRWTASDQAIAASLQARYTLFGRYDAVARVSAEYAESQASEDDGNGQGTGTALDLVAAWFIGLRF
ncbi:MAG TPA: hypothetical protein VI197_15825 [Polyangiaceae bacterium]